MRVPLRENWPNSPEEHRPLSGEPWTSADSGGAGGFLGTPGDGSPVSQQDPSPLSAVLAAKDHHWRGYTGLRSSSVLARKPSSRPGRCCIRLSRVFTSAVSSAMVCLVRLASDRFRCAQTGSTGVRSWAYGGRPEAGHQGRAATNPAHAGVTLVVRLSPTSTI